MATGSLCKKRVLDHNNDCESEALADCREHGGVAACLLAEGALIPEVGIEPNSLIRVPIVKLP